MSNLIDFIFLYIDEQVIEPNSRLIITSSNILNLIDKRSLNHEKLEKQEFDALLTETFNALRKVLINKTNIQI